MKAWKATFCLSDAFIATYRPVTIKKFLQFCNDGTVCKYNAIMLELQGSSMAMTFLVWFFGLILALVENIKIFQKIVVGCKSKKDNDHVRRGKMDQ